MRNIVLKEDVELKLPAQQSMMLVLRLTTAGVIARAGLTVDRMDDVKMAVEEACSCLIGAEPASERLCLKFSRDGQGLKIGVRCEADGGCAMGEEERAVVECILDSLVDGVELKMQGDAICEIEMRVALGQ